jgi:hypothetical protein
MEVFVIGSEIIVFQILISKAPILKLFPFSSILTSVVLLQTCSTCRVENMR